jgi:3-phosphoshikimate 1-carboxyvinyltransferase
VTASIEIEPVAGPLDAAIHPPGSKSITNRALVCAALAEGTSTLRGVLDSEDTAVMINALRALGIAISEDRAGGTARVIGCGGKIPARSADLYIANSGTSVRFLTALVALGHGTFRLHGTPRMHERPIQDLLDALGGVGVDAKSEAGNGCPPVVVQADGLQLERAGIRGDVSSQFASALLMVAPCGLENESGQPVEIEIAGSLVSEPYVAMTASVMRSFGAQVAELDAGKRFCIEHSGYRATDYSIEPDASAASYFWAAAAIVGGRVRVEGLSRASLQGDVAFCECLAKMGCRVDYQPDAITIEGGPLTAIDADMNAISDTVQTLSVVALFARGTTRIRGVAHIRHKETDRLAALATELRKLGATVVEHPDGLEITPGALEALHGAAMDTYDDHRMAMSFALAGLRVPNVVINDPGCTSKTYPRFFDDLARVCGR